MLLVIVLTVFSPTILALSLRETVLRRLVPSQLAQFPAILTKGFRGMGAEFAKLPGNTVKEVGVKAIVVFEVGCWFLLGEIIGRRSFFGYKYDLQ